MSKKLPSISIIIPVYNEEDCLSECLQAIERQKSMPEEVIVVDNNCQDDSMKIARKFKFVKIVKEKQQGMIAARNAGMNIAKGDVLCRIDADTTITPNWVRSVRHIFSDESIAAASGPIYYIDMPRLELGAKIDHQVRSIINRYAKDFRFLFGCNMAVRKSVWQKVQADLCMDEEFHEDIDIALHLHQLNYKISYNKEMFAGASARRLESNPADFYDYIMRFERTYKAHGVKSLMSRTPILIYLTTYFPLKLLHSGYDVDKRQLSLEKWLQSIGKKLKTKV